MNKPLPGELPSSPGPLRAAITRHWLADEATCVRALLDDARQPPGDTLAIAEAAADLVRRVRRRAENQGVVESFMRQYDLGSEEGVLLMCVAEALLRIPDQATTDALIRDKLGEADWKRHLGRSESVLVNASTWGLMLTGQLVDLADATRRDVHGAFKRLVGRVGEPVIRLAVRQAMKIMGHQFVMGRTIDEALARARKGRNANYLYSYDMLGEAALTRQDADRYLEAYRSAIDAIGRGAGGAPSDIAAPSISVKLSALHPRYEHAKRARVLAELAPRLLDLAQRAKGYRIGLTVDAEEADRLELSLDVIEAAWTDPSLAGWNGFGIVVQAYQKRAPFVIDWIAALARRGGRRIPVRLVKGAYWDAEVKRAQVEGHRGYPVFTRKPNTDVSYLACARRLLDAGDAVYPMFATHNAHTIAAVHRLAAGRPFEFQKLHGMGDDLYDEVIPASRLGVPCRVYAPVGSHEDLLPYLVRRLLENGANSSFVNRITDEDVAIEDLVRDPVEVVAAFDAIAHPRIPLPVDLFRGDPDPVRQSDRNNSMGINFANDDELRSLADAIAAEPAQWEAAPLVPGASSAAQWTEVADPADRRRVVGRRQRLAVLLRADRGRRSPSHRWRHRLTGTARHALRLGRQRRHRYRRRHAGAGLPGDPHGQAHRGEQGRTRPAPVGEEHAPAARRWQARASHRLRGRELDARRQPTRGEGRDRGPRDRGPRNRGAVAARSAHAAADPLAAEEHECDDPVQDRRLPVDEVRAPEVQRGAAEQQDEHRRRGIDAVQLARHEPLYEQDYGHGGHQDRGREKDVLVEVRGDENDDGNVVEQ